MKLLSLVCGIILNQSHAKLINGYEDEESNLKRIRSLCPCADQALESMAMAMYRYRDFQSKNPEQQPNVSKLVGQIKEIAYECTRRPECRCPDGYFKTKDGTECLKFAEVDADCTDAEKACADDFNSRLAIAKDHTRLTKIADVMKDINPSGNDYYWIGLSYNRTAAGMPVWTWVDGTRASTEISSDLNVDLKKSGITRIIDIVDGGKEEAPIERVAISSKYHGKVWRHESCRAHGLEGPPKHKYICEFMMFKVKINAETKAGKRIGKVGEF